MTTSLRSRARAAGWKTINNNIFRERGEWFLHSTWLVSKDDESTVLWFNAKPMELDHIFWDIVGLPENKNLKKSLRVNGAWTTHPPALFEDKIADSGLSVDEIAERILFWSDRSLELSLDHAILENLVTQIENNIHWQQRKSYSDALICAYVLTAQLGEARQLAQFCALHGQPVDYVVGDKNFGAMALDWLDARIPRRDPWKRATDAVRRFFMRPGDPLKW